MSVRKEKNGWTADFYLGGADGKRVRRVGFATKSLALAYQENQKRLYDCGDVSAKDDKRKVTDIIEYWFEVHGMFLANGEFCKNSMLRFAESVGNPLCKKLSVTHVNEYRKKLKEEDELENSTINKYLDSLCAMIRFLKRADMYHYPNVFAKVSKLRVCETELTYLNSEKLHALLKACAQCENKHVLPIVLICLYTGARWSEAEKLQRSQVGNRRITYVRTKTGKRRTVPITQELESYILDIANKRGSRLFNNSYEAYRYIYKDKLKFDTPQQCTHILRHTFASQFMMAGGNILVLKNILGHSDIKMTMVYSHFCPSYLEDAIKMNPVSIMGEKIEGSGSLVSGGEVVLYKLIKAQAGDGVVGGA